MNTAPDITGAVTAADLLQYLALLVAEGKGHLPVLLYWSGAQAQDGLQPCHGLQISQATKYRPYPYLEVI